MKTRESLHGFEVVSRRALPEYRADGTHLIHSTTGCEVFHLATTDTENLFAFCFATPPRDDTGVSHIIEHSVLSGSRSFPVKEPFSVLMKGSMHTFLNALTYPDRTVYPAASCNHADFFNLLTVYADAVFHPLLRKETFMQEAWRLEPGDAGSLHYAGVVYNEMKGAYSSPDSIVGEWTTRSLFPDTPYRFDSGGDPASIPGLTLQMARDFHALYYHPSNCRIFLYGDLPMEEVLGFIQDRFLKDFKAQEIDAVIPLQKRWKEPRRLEKTFPVKPDTPLAGRSNVTLSWLLPPVTDPVAMVTHEVLSEVLVESAGSPLRKALIDSGLGEDLSPVTGLETDLKEMIFAVGLRGTEPGKEPQIARIIMDTIKGLATAGLDANLVQSMMNRIEFRHREIRGNGSPYALRLMGRALRGWVHGLDPFASLQFASSMKELKDRVAADPRYLEKCLEASFVSNPHRLTLVVRPDQGQEEREAAEEAERVSRAVSRLSAAEREAALADARMFSDYQKAPDSPESLAAVPSLRRTDIPREVERIPHTDTRTPSGAPLALHDIFTNEIAYLDLAFPTGSLAAEQALLLPLFGRAVTGMGLPGISYDAVALDLFRLTGGFSASLDAGGIVGRDDEFGQFAYFRMRCLRQNLPEAAGLISRLLGAADFHDHARLRDILVELRNDMKSALIPGGHQFAMLRAASMLSPSVAREEQWRGITQMLFLEALVEKGDPGLSTLVESLERIRASLLSRPLLLANATASAECFPEIGRAVDTIAAALSAGTAPGMPAEPAAQGKRPRAESLVASASVGYVARAIPGLRYEHPLNGAMAVLGHILSTGYLWEKVRMEGGAYGAFSYPRNTDGLFLLGSYRDPHITSTLRAFEEGLAHMEAGGVDEAEVDLAVIGTIGREERPIDPGEKGFVRLQRSLHGVTDEVRQNRRTALLAVNRRSIMDVAHLLRDGFGRGYTAVIANKRSLQEAAGELPELGDRVIDLPE
jgi:Zn-dependent M16 (insulinase) family peptidase